jgi:hypothetical protein
MAEEMKDYRLPETPLKVHRPLKKVFKDFEK